MPILCPFTMEQRRNSFCAPVLYHTNTPVLWLFLVPLQVRVGELFEWELVADMEGGAGHVQDHRGIGICAKELSVYMKSY